jgi:hypothetical protein
VLVALVFGFTILAVLLYLWRSPATEGAAASDAGATPAPSAEVPTIVRTKVEPEKKAAPRLQVGPPQRIKCGAPPTRTAAQDSLCDSLPFFEKELARAIEQTLDCAPSQKEEGTINYVMAIDFRTHEVRIYPGQSGSWRGKQAKKAAECVKRALSAPTWATISHQYRYYLIAIQASYPARVDDDGLPDFK